MIQDQWSFSGNIAEMKQQVAAIGAVAVKLRGKVSVIAIENSPAIEAEFKPYPDVLLLRETAHGVRYAYGSSPRGMVLVAIDKAGFNRQIEPIADTGLIGPLMQYCGDTTPALQVPTCAARRTCC
jgi:hypothetical protein